MGRTVKPEQLMSGEPWSPWSPPARCSDCAKLIGASVADEPHSSLKLRSAAVLAPWDPHYFECGTCGAKLLRSQLRNDPGVKWRMR